MLDNYFDNWWPRRVMMRDEDTRTHRATMCSSANRTRRVYSANGIRVRSDALGCARLRSATLGRWRRASGGARELLGRPGAAIFLQQGTAVQSVGSESLCALLANRIKSSESWDVKTPPVCAANCVRSTIYGCTGDCSVPGDRNIRAISYTVYRADRGGHPVDGRRRRRAHFHRIHGGSNIYILKKA